MKKAKHLLSIESMNADDIREILAMVPAIKAERGRSTNKPLLGQTWALMFSKSSTRTRVSFEVGIRELGGQVMFLSANDLQLGRGEPIRDTARVLGRMLHGCVIRTYGQGDVEEFAKFSNICTINALTDEEHPCQILTELFTIQEKRGSLEGLKVAYLGDGACNVPVSWLWAAARLGFELRIVAPKAYQPDAAILERANCANVICTESVEDGVAGVDVIYTDVWVSMGMEQEGEKRIADLQAYQVNRRVLDLAAPGAMVLHCLPAYREKEITEEILEEQAETIFTEAENRLHTQKAVLSWLQM